MYNCKTLISECVLPNDSLHYCTRGHYINVNISKIHNPSTKADHCCYTAEKFEEVFLKIDPIITHLNEIVMYSLPYDISIKGVHSSPLLIGGLLDSEHPTFLYFSVINFRNSFEYRSLDLNLNARIFSVNK